MDVDALVRIAADYDLKLDRAALQAALEDDRFADWARTRLDPDNLLTVEELSLYTALDRSGRVDALVADRDLGAVLGLDEADLRAAIAELEHSTAAATERAETLRRQQAGLAKLAERRARAAAQRDEFEDRRRQARNGERWRLQAEVEEAVQMTTFRVSDLEQQGRAAAGTIHQAVDGALRADDRLLASLQKLGWELEPDDPEEAGTVRELREICMKLIKISVETVRTRLDRVFLEALCAPPSEEEKGEKGEKGEETELTASRDEIESLYAEILPVAQMAVEQQYLEPALRSVAAENEQRLVRSAAAVGYVAECLDRLLDRSGRLVSRVEAAQAYAAAASAVLTVARRELSSPTGTGLAPVSSSVPPSPSRTNPTKGTAAAVVNRALALALPAAQALNTNGDTDDNDAAAAADDSSSDPSLPISLPVLSRTLAERRLRAAEASRATQRAFETAIGRHMADARQAVQALRDSALAEAATYGSPTRESGLADPDAEASLAVLAEEVARVAEGVAVAERQMDAGMGGNPKRDEFVRRWGGGGVRE